MWSMIIIVINPLTKETLNIIEMDYHLEKKTEDKKKKLLKNTYSYSHPKINK